MTVADSLYKIQGEENEEKGDDEKGTEEAVEVLTADAWVKLAWIIEYHGIAKGTDVDVEVDFLRENPKFDADAEDADFSQAFIYRPDPANKPPAGGVSGDGGEGDDRTLEADTPLTVGLLKEIMASRDSAGSQKQVGSGRRNFQLVKSGGGAAPENKKESKTAGRELTPAELRTLSDEDLDAYLEELGVGASG